MTVICTAGRHGRVALRSFTTVNALAQLGLAVILQA